MEMKIEDYSQYYIQGSDHYLLPKYIFEEVMYELDNWRKQCYEAEEKIYYVVEDLSESLNLNKHHEEKVGVHKFEYICMDVDHIEHLINVLKDDSNDSV